MTDKKKDDLEERVNQFCRNSLPGHGFDTHMGTYYLVNDLWREVKRLRDELKRPPEFLDAALNSGDGVYRP